MGFHLVFKFRDDAYLKYITNEAKSGKKGKPMKFDGKIDFSNIDSTKFEKINLTLEGEFYSAIVHSKALNTQVRIVIWFSSKKDIHKL